MGVSKDCESGASLEEKGEEMAEQTLPKGRISGTEGTDRREVRSQLLRGGRQQVLPVHSQGRMYALDIQGDVCRTQHVQFPAIPSQPGCSRAIYDPGSADGSIPLPNFP